MIKNILLFLLSILIVIVIPYGIGSQIADKNSTIFYIEAYAIGIGIILAIMFLVLMIFIFYQFLKGKL